MQPYNDKYKRKSKSYLRTNWFFFRVYNENDEYLLAGIVFSLFLYMFYFFVIWAFSVRNIVHWNTLKFVICAQTELFWQKYYTKSIQYLSKKKCMCVLCTHEQLKSSFCPFCYLDLFETVITTFREVTLNQ